jgi:hypothetical protein
VSNDTAAIVCASAMAAFFACFFGTLLWKTRARADPELDRVYTELAITQAPMPSASRALGGMRSVVRAYIVLGAAVTALGLLAVVQEGLEFGSAAATVGALVAIVVVWAAAVPLVLRRANAASVAVLAPLGLRQNGTVMAGERHGRRVSIEITAAGSVTRVDAPEGAIVIRRKGHDGASWLRDLQEAEMQAAGRGR